MAKVSSKITPIRQTIRDITKPRKGQLTAKPLGDLRKPRDPQVLPENTRQGVKQRVPVNVPGVKTQ